jgi:hypothetical protein
VWLETVDDAIAAALVPAGASDDSQAPADTSSSPDRRAAKGG